MIKRKRGRPCKFDSNEVLDKALDVFWENGYSATSLDMIAKATKVNRPSLAAAFGDKRALYLKTLDHFSLKMKDKLAQQQSISSALLSYYLSAIDLYFSGNNGAKGCLVITTASAEAAHDPEIRQTLKNVLDAMDKAHEQRFKQALMEGQLPKSTDIKTLTKLTTAILHSIAIRARAGEDKQSLIKMAKSSVELLIPTECE